MKLKLTPKMVSTLTLIGQHLMALAGLYVLTAAGEVSTLTAVVLSILGCQISLFLGLATFRKASVAVSIAMVAWLFAPTYLAGRFLLVLSQNLGITSPDMAIIAAFASMIVCTLMYTVVAILVVWAIITHHRRTA